MNEIKFKESLIKMRENNFGQQFDRRELGLLATRYGIYFNSIMWVCGLDKIFIKNKFGPKFVYVFNKTKITDEFVKELLKNVYEYNKNKDRKIEHAKTILRKYGINKID